MTSSPKAWSRPGPALAALAIGLAVAGCERQPDEAFGQRLRAYLLEHPEVIREAALKLQEQERLGASAAVAPSRDQQVALERDPRDVVANPNGRITVIEFFDYRCGYCKQVAPEVARFIEHNPDVRFVFKEFPIFGGDSETAAQVMLTPAAKWKAGQLHRALMAEPSLDQAAIDRHLTAVGLDPTAVRQAAQVPAIQQQLLATKQLAASLGIDGTPAFVIGDQVVSGADIPALRYEVEKARKARKRWWALGR